MSYHKSPLNQHIQSPTYDGDIVLHDEGGLPSTLPQQHVHLWQGQGHDAEVIHSQDTVTRLQGTLSGQQKTLYLCDVGQDYCMSSILFFSRIHFSKAQWKTTSVSILQFASKAEKREEKHKVSVVTNKDKDVIKQYK